jgi:hypothetical protein
MVSRTGELVKQHRMLGDVASALDVPLSDMVYVLRNARAQWRAYARDVMQFYDARRPVDRRACEGHGITSAEVRDAVESGRSDSKQVEQAFKNMNGRGWPVCGMLEKQSRTWSGQTAKLRDNINLALAAFGTPIINKLNAATRGRE